MKIHNNVIKAMNAKALLDLSLMLLANVNSMHILTQLCCIV